MEEKKLNFSSKFALGDFVIVDEDASMRAIITQISFRTAGYIFYELSWIHNGQAQTAMFEEFRLKLIG